MGRAPSATCSLQPRKIERVTAAAGILDVRTGGTTYGGTTKFRSPREIELYFSTRV
jgi:hypothetical protein